MSRFGNFGGNIGQAKGSGNKVAGGNKAKPAAEKSKSKKSEVTRRKRRKAARAALEVQAKDLLKKY